MNADARSNMLPSRSASLVSRRTFLRTSGALGALAALQRLAPAYARPLVPSGPLWQTGEAAQYERALELSIQSSAIRVGNRRATATTINDTVPGPLLRFREGDDAVIRVTNHLKEDTSLHWHGILVPNAMDGVPDVTFAGIRPRETFTYHLPLRQYGTYWYHSHSGLQEQTGVYGPLIIDPIEPEPFSYDREYVVMLSDWTFEDPYRVIDKLKKDSGYFNFQKRTVGDLFRRARKSGFHAALDSRLAWAKMRMDPTDIADVTSATYTYLLNGLPPASNWTGLFNPGERVRLRFINGSAGTYFDVRVPGLEMSVVAVSGQHVRPVATDEIRIAIAETYDVIVQPTDDRAYSIFAESMDRSGFARGTLAPRAGMTGAIPARRSRPTLSMADMGMDMSMADMNMPGREMTKSATQATTKSGDSHHPDTTGAGAAGMHMPARETSSESPRSSSATDTSGMMMPGMAMPGSREDSIPPHDVTARAGMATPGTGIAVRAPGTLPQPVAHGPDSHGSGNSTVPMITQSRLHEPGLGLGEDGWRVLVYTDLRSLTENPVFRAPTREIEIHLTGNMERYMWSIDGVKFSDVKEPVHLLQGERIRLTLVNDTMMQHPMHLHGMWMELENGNGAAIPRVHTINVKPAERVSLLATPEATGPWAFHCHILFHMEMGMFRVFEVLPAKSHRDMPDISR